MIRKLVVVGALLLVAGCGSGDNGTEKQPAAPTGSAQPSAAAKASGTLWVGDSATNITDVTDVAVIGDKKLLWLDSAGKVHTGSVAGSQVNATEVAGLPATVVDIAAARTGDSFSAAAISSDGHLWVWGTVPGVSVDPLDKPAVIPTVSDVASVTVGPTTMFAVTRAGDVYSWGDTTEYKVLGREAEAGQPQPPGKIEGLSDIAGVTITQNAGIALTRDGKAFGWGSNNYEALIPGDQPAGVTPVPMTTLTDIAAIDARDFAVYAVEKSGALLAWGDGAAGHLGDASKERAPVQEPVTLPIENVVAVAAGTPNVAVTKDGAAVAWGTAVDPSGAPKPLDGVKGKVTAAVVDDGAVYLIVS